MALLATLGLDSSGYEKGLKGAESGAQQFANKLTGYFKMAATALSVGAIARGLLKVARLGFDYNKQIESLTASFEVLMGSADAAVKQIDQLKVMAAKTPFGLTDLADATKTLLAFQIPAEEATNLLSQLGDIALGDKQKLSSLALVMGQVSSAGRLNGGDLMQMINQGFNPLNEIAKRTGETMEQLRDRMSKGKISYKEVALAIKDATSEGGMFYQGMEKASQTAAGLESTLADNWASFWGQLMEPVNEQWTNAILPALIDGLQRASDALFGTGEDAEEMRKKLWGEDEEGNANDPGANLQKWLTDLMTAWTDGIAEDNDTVEGFVNTFKANTELIKTALHDRYANAVDEDEKTKIEEQLALVEGYETRVEELLKKRQGGYITPEEEEELNTILATLQQIQADTEAAAGIDEVESSWSKLVGTIGSIAVDAIDKVVEFLEWFLNPENGSAGEKIAKIAGNIFGVKFALKGLSTLLATGNPFMLIVAALMLVVANWDAVKSAVAEAGQAIYEWAKKIYTWIDENIIQPIQTAIDKILEFLGLKRSSSMDGDEGAGSTEQVGGYQIIRDQNGSVIGYFDENGHGHMTNEVPIQNGDFDTSWITPSFFAQPTEASATTPRQALFDLGEDVGRGVGSADELIPPTAEETAAAIAAAMGETSTATTEAIVTATNDLESGLTASFDDLKTKMMISLEQIAALPEAIRAIPFNVSVYVNADKFSAATATSDRNARNKLNNRTALGVGQ